MFPFLSFLFLSSLSPLSLSQVQTLLLSSSKSHQEKKKMVGCSVRKVKKRKPEWINNLLSSKFFGLCTEHKDLRKNEKNMFCIDCSIGFCKHCITSSSSSSPHCFHRWLQICKYVYHYVVRLQDIQQHLDCSRIQTYKINGEKAVHLNPRPHSKDSKISKSKVGASCQACGRHIQDLPNCFCSIACKVSIVSEMYKEMNHKMISIPLSQFNNFSLQNNNNFVCNNSNNYQNIKNSFISVTNSSSSSSSLEDDDRFWLRYNFTTTKKQLHKRKGIPRRSPLH